VTTVPPEVPITFERHGGFGGIVLHTTFTSGELSEPEVEAITAVQEERASQRREPQPDRFEYHLHLPSGQLIINEEDLPDTLRPLITRLLERARQRG
jgi:hypothetical protein